MDKKQIAIKLSKLKNLNCKNAGLEQYQTDSELAAEITWNSYIDGNIKNKTVADLGCGNGIIGNAALILRAKKVYFIDKDKNAVETCMENNSDYKNAEFICDDVTKFSKRVDTVLMNPPFGVRERKADKTFLLKAFEIAREIYSIHKTGSERFIETVASENGFSVKSVIPKNFIIKKIYKFHKRDNYTVKVGIWHISKNI